MPKKSKQKPGRKPRPPEQLKRHAVMLRLSDVAYKKLCDIAGHEGLPVAIAAEMLVRSGMINSPFLAGIPPAD
jgi:hypothetical protein